MQIRHDARKLHRHLVRIGFESITGKQVDEMPNHQSPSDTNNKPWIPRLCTSHGIQRMPKVHKECHRPNPTHAL